MRIRSIAALVGLVVLVAACSAGPGTGGELQGTKWILRSYDNAGTLTLVPENEYADIEFDSNRATGFSGCNTFDARYRSGGRTLFISVPNSGLLIVTTSPISCVMPSPGARRSLIGVKLVPMNSMNPSGY